MRSWSAEGGVIHVLLVVGFLCWAVGFVVVLANLAVTPRLGRAPALGPPVPRVSVVIPARDEERSIALGVGSHLAQDYPDYEVIVVDDRSTDRTGEILASLAASSARLRVVEGSEPPPGWLGKPHALNLGAAAATGELLLFVDADVIYHPRALAEAVASLEALRADFLCLMPRMEARGFWENVLMPYVIGAFFFGPGFLANLDRPRWFAVGGGAGNLIRREAYGGLGGHEALKNSVVDDVRLAFAAKWAGFRTRAVRAEDRVAVRMYCGFSEICDGFSKNMAYVFNGAVGVLLAFLTALTTSLAVAAPLILFASLAGLPLAPRDLGLAAASTGLMVATRLVLAAALRDPIWPSLTHPIMAAVWAGIISRSFYYRFLRKRLTWRGREFDARAAGF